MNLLQNLLQISISAGILIIAITCIRVLAINRLPKGTFIVLWTIALCRLLIPISFRLEFSIFNFGDYIIHNIFQHKTRVVRINWKVGDLISKSTGYMELIHEPLQVKPLVIVWIIGAAFVGLYFLVSFNKCYREIRTALPLKDISTIDNWLNKQKTERTLKILVSDRISTPLTYGILKPKIILPKSMDFDNKIQMEYVLTHEFVHIRRFDFAWKILIVIATSIHWFNPLVWMLYFWMNMDLELACDEKVIKMYGENTKSDYALSLIEIAGKNACFSSIYSNFSNNATETRIISIMKFKKTSLLGLVVAFILIGAAATVFVEGTADRVSRMTRIHGIIHVNQGIFAPDPGKNGAILMRDANGRGINRLDDGFDPDDANYRSNMLVKYIVEGVKKSVVLEHYEGLVMTIWTSSQS
ncbi:MAG: M56 family metallopeptidase [Clostridiaceae bacterium]|nr:M56 family metallopeptidase [Clostridiaceae bacterium]